MIKLVNFVLILFLYSCASGHRKEQAKLRTFYKSQNYSEVFKILKKGDLKKDKDSKLLFAMENASAYFGEAEYQKAIKHLLTAKDLTDKYFTKSVVKSIATSTILNENFKKFTGAFYEKSLVHYLLVASYYNTYKRGSVKIPEKKGDKTTKFKELTKKKKRDYLFKARAEVLAWDTFFEEIKTTFKSKTTFHFDLLVKLYGGLIHEEIGKRSELNISLILYQDAYKILNTMYPNFASYNKKYKEYFEKAKSKKIKFNLKAPKEKEFTQTENYKTLNEYIKFKILNLAYRYNKSKFKRLKKVYPISSIRIKEIKSKKSLVNITINQGLIPKKMGKTVNLGLIGMMEGIEDSGTKKLVMGIGVPLLTIFAMNELGLYPSHRYMGRGEFRSYNAMFKVTAKAMSIEYEVPIIESFTNTSQYFLVFKQNKAEVKRIAISKIASLGDFAKADLEDTAVPRIMRKASRVALKHLGAIASAFATYNGFAKDKHGNRSPFAKFAAMGQYALLSKAIEQSEKADVRFWSTLPKNVLQVETKLAKGDYSVFLERAGKVLVTYNIGQVKVTKKKNFFTYHRPDII